MSRLVRKNLMVDPDELRALAQERGASESEAIRDAVRLALAGREAVAALRGLHDAGRSRTSSGCSRRHTSNPHAADPGTAEGRR